ncbi:MAG TPA: SulP family inorganic anion transporter [Pseudonocardiaceae bacterium]|nr:SulP family inorganic anion transporter [Pseudonocardiaceae bacterium]
MISRRMAVLVPGLPNLVGYHRSWLRRDSLAGLTVAAYLVPQVMAYAAVAGLPPVAGLWAAIPSLAVYALLGSSRQLSVGPESTTALLAAAAILPFGAASPARYAALAAGLAIIVGAICLIAWLVRLGFLADLLSKPVLVGYLAGVAVIMIVSQLHRTTGVPVTGVRLGQQLRSFVSNLDEIDWPTLLLSLAVLAFLFAVLLVLLIGGPLLSHFPEAALGALIIYAATRLIDLPEFKRIARFRRSELVLALTAFAGVLVLNILYGVLVAIGVSVADLLRRVARPHDAILGQVQGLAGMHDVDDYPTAHTIPGLVVYRYDSPLFFANADDFKHRAMAAAEAATQPQWFLLNVEANVEVDITGLDAVEWLRQQLHHRGIIFAMARVKQDLLTDLKAYGLADNIGPDRLFPTLPTAVAAYQSWTRNHH